MKKNLSPNVKTINMHTREKIFADMLISQKRKWLYESKRFKLKTSHYTPDFYLPNENLYIEIIGTRQAYHANKKKISEFKTLYPNINFIILDYKGNPYPPKDRRIYPSIKRIKKGKYNICPRCQKKVKRWVLNKIIGVKKWKQDLWMH